ncbi:MAG: hypothetical protein ACYCWW_20070 [Deltaproteobacteria bacterium]
MRALFGLLLLGLGTSCGYVFPSCQTIPPCPVGQTLCTQMSCSDLTTDRYNCGSCGNICAPGFVCRAGADGGPECGCPTEGAVMSNGACLDLQIDGQNCGAIGNVCPAGLLCVQGICACGGFTDGGAGCLSDGGVADGGAADGAVDGGADDGGLDGGLSDAGFDGGLSSADAGFDGGGDA